MAMRSIALFSAAVYLSLYVSAAAQDKATIERLNEQFVAALQKGDMAALGSMYSEDAYLLPPGAEIIKGRAAIQAYWTKAAEGVAGFKLTTHDMKPLGTEAAREVGTFALTTKGQQPQEIAGKYVVVWERSGGQWRLASDIWNTSK
jgi:uncharacterized protein (TIGR02246 family)